MNIEDLRQIHAHYCREKPKIFELSTPDLPASEQQIETLERGIGIRLSQSYGQFLREFGGGNFGLTTIFSADPNSEWYLLRKQNEAGRYIPQGLLSFSDDFAGGYYALRVLNGRAQEPVIYWNRDGGETVTEFNSIRGFVARYAYEPA